MNDQLAGRALDALVAEKVMGWNLADRRRLRWGEGPDCWITGDDEAPTRQWFAPSIDIASAWKVVEKLDAFGGGGVLYLYLSRDAEDGWAARFYAWGASESCQAEWSKADTAPLAICRAALAIMEEP